MNNDNLTRRGARLSLVELRLRTAGRWPEILAALGLPADSLTRQNKPCPACGGTDRFSFTDQQGSGSFVCRALDRQGGDGFELVKHWLGGDLRAALAAVTDALDSGASPPPARAPGAAAQAERPAKPKPDGGEVLRRLWNAAAPLRPDDPATLYLAGRGLHPPSPLPALRCHPDLPYWHTVHGHPCRLGSSPALLAAVQGEDGITVALHRTYLTADGRKAVYLDPDSGAQLAVKKLKTRGERVMSGAAVRLFSPADGRLGVTEGIETGLAVHQATGLAVWACVSASGLAAVWLPPEVREVFITADNDESSAGQRAADTLAARLRREGRRVEVLFPSRPGQDWLDVLNADGSQP